MFTTHTPVAAGFGRFPLELLGQYRSSLTAAGIDPDHVVALARADEDGTAAPFSMAYLAARGALSSVGVSRLHGTVSRRIFQPLFPRWPEHEVPISHITNGVHVPSWDSREADQLWTDACGKDRWRSMPDDLHVHVAALSDVTLWAMRGKARQVFVERVRTYLERQLGGRGHSPEAAAVARNVLDPNILTLGLARRFTGYKRTDLLLRDRARFARLLNDEQRPIQIVVAGKAHPDDEDGKRMIQEWIAFARQSAFRHRVVFLEDYDIALAQELVQGVDVWSNMPRPILEACGTSGMKVLVNGGLNLSVLGGWWEEAYAKGLGWSIASSPRRDEDEQDACDAEQLYAVLEREIVPEFYDRDTEGLPRAWLARMRRSMAELTPRYSSTRMVRAYLEQAYLPAAQAVKQRASDGAAQARAMAAWEQRVRRNWNSVHIGAPDIARDGDAWVFTVAIYLGEMAANDIQVSIYADPDAKDGAPASELAKDAPIPGAANGYVYTGRVPASRPAGHYTVRVLPHHPDVRAPTELALILWQK